MNDTIKSKEVVFYVAFVFRSLSRVGLWSSVPCLVPSVVVVVLRPRRGSCVRCSSLRSVSRCRLRVLCSSPLPLVSVGVLVVALLVALVLFAVVVRRCVPRFRPCPRRRARGRRPLWSLPRGGAVVVGVFLFPRVPRGNNNNNQLRTANDEAALRRRERRQSRRCRGCKPKSLSGGKRK